MKLERSSPSYSSAAGRSSKPWRTFFWDTVPNVSLAFFLAATASSSSVVRLNRSSTRFVSMESKPEFCCVTTEFATFNLKRCRLYGKIRMVESETRSVDVPHNLLLQGTFSYQAINVHHLPLPNAVRSIHGL